jgi:YegS/Rv2252/BmrU family lipid kinase
MSCQRIALVVNPASGKRRGLKILDQVRPFFSAHRCDLEVLTTSGAGHARELARTLPLDRFDCLCMIGGDGTFHEIATGLMQRGAGSALPLGLIPGGTGNDVAQHLGLSDPIAAAQRILGGRAVAFDVARVELGSQSTCCVTLVGWAGVADINCLAERLRPLGAPRYACAAFWQIAAAVPRHATLVLDNQTIEDDFLLVVACNTVYSGSGMRLAPCARTDDGLIDVVIVRRASRWRMLQLLARVFRGSHVEMPEVECHQVRALRIATDTCQTLDIDGEIASAACVSLHTVPGALRVLV